MCLGDGYVRKPKSLFSTVGNWKTMSKIEKKKIKAVRILFRKYGGEFQVKMVASRIQQAG